MAAKKSSKTKSAAQVASQSAAAQRQASIERSAGIAAKVAPSLSTPTTSSSTKTTPSLNTPTVSSALPNGRTGEKLTINQTTNEIVGVGSGKIYGKGNSLAEALALQTQMQSGSAPTLTGRPDLFAVAPNADQKVESFKDPQTGTTVNPRTASADELAQHKAGTLINYPKSQGLTYLDGPTFSGLQKNLTEADLVRMPDGRIYLKQGLTIDAINARNAATPAGTTTTTPTDESVTVDIPDTVDSDMLDEAMVDPQTEEDLMAISEEQTKLQQDYLNSLGLSDEETALRDQLAELHAEVSGYSQSLQAGLDSIEDEAIPMSFITGQQASLERRSQRQMQIFADEEANLLERLGFAQEAREMKSLQAEAAVNFFKDNLELRWKIEDRVQDKEDRVLARADKLETKARDNLSAFLEMFEGYDVSDLSAESQAKLATMAASAGLPFDLVTEGMSAVKDRILTEAFLKEGTTQSEAEKRAEEFGSDIADTIYDMGMNQLDWGTAWDMIKAKYPEVPNAVIDANLGGGMNSDGSWWGRASTDPKAEAGSEGGASGVLNSLGEWWNRTFPGKDEVNTSASTGSISGTIKTAVDGFKARVLGAIKPLTTLTNIALGSKTIQLNTAVAWRFQKADEEYYEATGKHIPVSEHYRTPERQMELYKKLSARGARVAPQGYSFHEVGMAVDVGEGWRDYKPYLNKYGFINGLEGDMGHFSIGEIS
jgi:hypothetical protein